MASLPRTSTHAYVVLIAGIVAVALNFIIPEEEEEECAVTLAPAAETVTVGEEK